MDSLAAADSTGGHHDRAASLAESRSADGSAAHEPVASEITLENVLANRYASPRMRRIWSPQRRVVLERRLWLAVLRAQRHLGLDVEQAVIDAYEAVVEVVDLDSIAAREQVSAPRRQGSNRRVLRARGS